MENEYSGYDYDPGDKPSLLDRLIRRVDEYPHQYCAKNEKENPQDSFARRTANATVWIAVLTFVTAGVGGLQYCTFKEQLGVMQGQLDAMQDDQRPWVYISRPEIEQPGLQFAKEGADLTIKLWYKNVGHSPAKFVVATGEMLIVGPVEYGNPRFESCEARRNTPRPTVTDGTAAFPGQEGFLRRHFAIKSDQVERLKGPTMAVVLVGCIDYLFASGPDHHQTRFFYELDKKGPNETFLKVDPDNPPIGASAIDLAVNPNIARDAD